jgi:glycosyltransferase involved in cell wall biosynthesis
MDAIMPSGDRRSAVASAQAARSAMSTGQTRAVDLRFYRSAYEDSAGVDDENLIAAIRDGRLPPERPLNPTEFIQQVLASKRLPPDFDPTGYRINTPELWGSDRADWEIVLHFLRFGQARKTSWKPPFDRDFYRDLYRPSASLTEVIADRQSNPGNYGSLAEVLVKNGWSSQDWTTVFDQQAYAVYNSLTETLRTPVQAIVHFIEHGWRDMLAMSAEHEFDLAYFVDWSGGSNSPGRLVAHEVYKKWVEVGLLNGLAPNERSALRAMGLALSRYPEGFDWQTYLDERPSVMADADGRTPGRWDALQHLVDTAVVEEGPPLPLDPAAAAEVLLAAGDRFSVSGREDEAATCYSRALLLPNPSPRLLQHAADLETRRKRPARALSLYRQVRATGNAGFWTWCNGAHAALSVGLWDEATDWVITGLAAHPRSTKLEATLLEIQRARYDRAVTRHLSALRNGSESTEIVPALDSILALFLAAYTANFGTIALPQRPTEGRLLRVVMLANQDLAQCTYYRVDAKRQQLGLEQGIDLKIFERSEAEAFRSAAATADLAIFYRLASDVDVLQCIAACRAAGIPTVYEVDDLVFDEEAFPEPLAAYDGAITADQHFGLRAGVALVRHTVAACDAAIASTEQLAVQMRALVRSGRALVHRNGLSAELAKIARDSAPRGRIAEDNSVTLFYGSGTRAHAADFRDILAPALDRLMGEDDTVRFIACGYVNASSLAERYPGRVEQVDPVTDRDAYLSQLLSVDINLAVLQAGAFNDCKSEIKWLEAAAFCVPSVVSDVEGYRETLKDGTHLVRVSPKAEAWYSALRSLVANPKRRAAIAAAARDRALALYTPEVLGQSLANELRDLVRPVAATQTAVTRRRGVPAEIRRPRILLANVFFPPQAIGGATRVVRDQAAELLARYSNYCDIGILCGNDEATQPYSTQIYGWGGVPVWSVGCPMREHMDWFAFDPAMAAPVDAVLDQFKPDLVHAHCIQRLTATTLQQVAARAIPYVVTAHDAWWISDHQFLMDATNRLKMPWDIEGFSTSGNPHTRNESWSRRLQLRRVLDGAAAVLVVSESFASVYRRAGITQARAVPNGLPDLPPLEPSPATPGRVRLAHLGGVMAHKGYFLLRKAIERGGYRNLELLVMDHGLLAGEERRERWGSTQVTVTGRVPQERIGALYGSFDVLCAPSLWPESFGLVAREALHYGRWVIASTLGAMGEDVTPGKNGWLVDVTSAGAIEAVLAEIDADPLRFSKPSKSIKPSRTVSDQVDDVVQVYKSVLQAKSPKLAVAVNQMESR